LTKNSIRASLLIVALMACVAPDVAAQRRGRRAPSRAKASTVATVGADFLIVPGRAVGRIRLGMTRREVVRLLGRPTSTTDDSSLVYLSKQGESTELFFSKRRVAQINFTSKSYATREGVNAGNFLYDKFGNAFDKWKLKWRFVNIKYTLKSGGLTFYNLNADSADSDHEATFVGVVHAGARAPFEPLSLDGAPNGGWKQWDGRDLYSSGDARHKTVGR
jgi:hypothetical protein